MKKFFLFVILITIHCIASSCLNRANTGTVDELYDTIPASDTNIYVTFALYNDFDTALAWAVAKSAEEFYGVKCLPFLSKKLPDDAYNAAWARYSADSLLDLQVRSIPSNADFIQGLTDRDIYTPTEKSPYWGIFGLGSLIYPTSVVSTFRLHAGNCSDAVFKERLIKVALHELGHNFGLEHCPTPDCMMEDARGTIVSVDNEKVEVCSLCKKQLKDKFISLRRD